MSPSDHEEENDPDGIFAFRRKRNCHYHAVSSGYRWLYWLLYNLLDDDKKKMSVHGSDHKVVEFTTTCAIDGH